MWILNRVFLIVALLMVAGAARPDGIGGYETIFGGLSGFGGIGRTGKAIVQPTGKILLVDGVSHLLQTDGTSKVCLAGGC